MAELVENHAVLLWSVAENRGSFYQVSFVVRLVLFVFCTLVPAAFCKILVFQSTPSGLHPCSIGDGVSRMSRDPAFEVCFPTHWEFIISMVVTALVS